MNPTGSLTVDFVTGLPVTGSINTSLDAIQFPYFTTEEIGSGDDDLIIG